ncbi:hypothetical protein [Nonomuraea sp. LPB2021202275-12-8]|uniref:hypothetical protein n=1 Tax=Nonomuraea sp. LPB2021202275-12-8 TaxID=3120159 RepID=UPI00300D4A43
MIIREIQARMGARVDDILRGAAAGDGLYAKLLRQGLPADIEQAIRELDGFAGT